MAVKLEQVDRRLESLWSNMLWSIVLKVAELGTDRSLVDESWTKEVHVSEKGFDLVSLCDSEQELYYCSVSTGFLKLKFIEWGHT